MERLEGLEDGEIPIEPAQQTYNNIEMESGDRKRRRLKRAVLWRQLPVTGWPNSCIRDCRYHKTSNWEVESFRFICCIV